MMKLSIIALTVLCVYVWADDISDLNKRIEIYSGVKSFECKESLINGNLIKKCYYLLSRESKGESEAKNRCKELDPKAELMTIDSKEDQKFVESFVTTSGIKSDLWLGLEYGYGGKPRENPQNLRWRWAGQTDAHYTNWCPGKNCAFDDEDYRNYGDCARMSVKNDSLGLWYSHPCESQLIVICDMSSK